MRSARAADHFGHKRFEIIKVMTLPTGWRVGGICGNSVAMIGWYRPRALRYVLSALISTPEVASLSTGRKIYA